MKIRMYLLVIIMFVVCMPAVNAQEYGLIRALEQRAVAVIKQKNDFVSKVLASYKIPHERNIEGAVVRIHKDNQWLDITTIEIVPLLKEATGERQQVAAHQLLFYTSGGVLDLVAEVIIR